MNKKSASYIRTFLFFVSAAICIMMALTSCTKNGSDKKLPDISLNFTGCEFGDGAVTLKYDTAGDAGHYKIKATDGTEFGIDVPGEGTVSLMIKDKDNFTVGLKAEGTALNTELTYKKGFPQLSECSAGLIAKAMTNAELAHMVIGDWTASQGSGGATWENEIYGIPKTMVADGPCGVRWTENTVWYPSCSLMASTWNDEIVEMIGKDIGEDCVSLGIDVILGPGENIQRSVLNGRNFEYFSEDPLLAGMIGTAYTKGVQSTGTGVSVKHYAVNNQESSRGSVSAEVSERALREIYLRGFGYIVRNANPYTIMSSYNKVNGKYASVNEDLLYILRGEFGFRGYVMSDWGAQGDVIERMLYGNDVSMEGKPDQYNTVLNALENGSLSREYVEKAVTNILSTVAKGNACKKRPTGKIDHESQAKDALKAAEEGMVLLKNSGNTLPYKNGTVALYGKASFFTVFGGEGSGGVNISPSDKITILQGFEESCLKTDPQIYERLLSFYQISTNEFSEKLLDSVNESAKNCGLAIVTVSRTTSEGADHISAKGDWALSDSEISLISEVSSAFHKNGGKLLVILNTGNPIKVCDWEEYADAILWCGMAGEQVGHAVANIVTGAVNPSGKLTCTWPVDYTPEYIPYFGTFPGSAAYSIYNDDIYVGYRFNTTFNIPSQYEFGYGLSYTDFEYSDFTVSGKTVSADKPEITCTVTVRNTGSVSGKEIVQIYVEKPSEGKIEQPKAVLAGYAKTKLLKPGESQKITVTVTEHELETYVEETSSWRILSGTYKFSAGASVLRLFASAEVQAEQDILVQDVENRCVNTSDIHRLTQAEGFIPSERKISLALNAKTKSNGNEGGKYPAKNICDGNPSTRWSGAGASGERFITIDMGESHIIDEIEISWESNSANIYTVFTSENGTDWTELCTVNMKIWSVDTLKCDGLSARIIKITVPETASWCSIYEVNVFGK